ncbi:hypothetical protein GJAV_G00128390 [Gymnothorax javanicus]|nr:hypothetical protein GJAV_G00128390 [Gymnothorax javanicus]
MKKRDPFEEQKAASTARRRNTLSEHGITVPILSVAGEHMTRTAVAVLDCREAARPLWAGTHHC